MPYCTNCGTKLDDRANFCPNCGTAVSNKWQNHQSQYNTPPPPEPFMNNNNGNSSSQIPPPPEQTFGYSEDAVRKGMVKAKFNEQMVSVVAFEIAIIAIIIGLAASSWMWGLGTFIALVVLIPLPNFGKVLCYILGIIWGALGYFLGSVFFGSTAAWIIGFIAGFCGLYINLAARQYGQDLDSY